MSQLLPLALAAMLAGVPGCTHTRTSVDTHVAAVNIVAGDLTVTRCDLELIVDDSSAAMIPLFILLVPLMLFGGGSGGGLGPTTKRRFESTRCTTTALTVPGSVQ